MTRTLLTREFAKYTRYADIPTTAHDRADEYRLAAIYFDMTREKVVAAYTCAQMHCNPDTDW